MTVRVLMAQVTMRRIGRLDSGSGAGHGVGRGGRSVAEALVVDGSAGTPASWAAAMTVSIQAGLPQT